MGNLVKGKYGHAEIADCLARMATMPDQSFDLAWIDPPFNVKYGQGKFAKGGVTYEFEDEEKDALYEDDKENPAYIEIMRAVLPPLRRVARCVVVHPGYVNEKLWWDNVAPPDFTLSRMPENSKNGGQNARIRFRNPLLCYGKPPKSWKTDLFKTLVPWGFIPHLQFVHKCPMAADFMIPLLHDAGVQSAYDPMGGSGFLAEAAEAIGVKWFLTELDSRYISDIETRIWVGRRLRDIFRSQRGLFDKNEGINFDYTPEVVAGAYAMLRRQMLRDGTICRPKAKKQLPKGQHSLF